MIEIPIAEDERTRRTPVAPLTAVSTGKVTIVSTSSVAIPCASVRITTVGAVRSGNTSTGICMTVKEPTIRRAAAPIMIKNLFLIDAWIILSSMSRFPNVNVALDHRACVHEYGDAPRLPSLRDRRAQWRLRGVRTCAAVDAVLHLQSRVPALP